MRTFVSAAAILILLGMTLGCASSTGPGPGPSYSAKDELKIGVEAAKRGYWQEALLRFQQADRARPQQVKILNNLAVALEAVARYEEAMVTYEAALAIAPSNRNLRRNHQQFKEFYRTYIEREQPKDEAEKTEQGDQAGPEETRDEEENS